MFFRVTSHRSPVSAVLDLFLPPRCHCCRVHVDGGDGLHLCGSCMGRLQPIASPLCTCCGTPFLTAGGRDHLCGDCIRRPPPFTLARAPFSHEGPIRDMIHRFKYGHQVRLRRPLGLLLSRMMTAEVNAWRPDLLIPVPLHPRRLRQRGFNQDILIGTLLAKEWRIPIARTALSRTRWTIPQVELHHAAREANVKGAFSVPDPGIVAGRRVILLDDVLTTGSTVAECARMLRAARAEAVYVLAVARALLDR